MTHTDTSPQTAAPPDDSRARSTAAFELDDIGYQYPGGSIALESVSLRIEQGERVALLGANGCGKSTLIKLLDGLIPPTHGRISAFGKPLAEETLRDEAYALAFHRRVGFIFQNSDAQLFSATGREEIAFGPLQMGLTSAEIARRTADVAALLGIEALLDRPPFQLSGGEKKKLAIASTLVLNPDVLLLDEPTNGLDPRSQSELIDLLARLGQAGKTLVIATHDLLAVPLVAERAVVFSEAHTLISDGPCSTILADTALLLRANLIHAHLHRHGSLLHSHPHSHDGDHRHDHEA